MPVSHVIVKEITYNSTILSYELICAYQGNKIGRLKAMGYARKLAKDLLETIGKSEYTDEWDIPFKGARDRDDKHILSVGFRKRSEVYNYHVIKVSGGPVMSPSPRI